MIIKNYSIHDKVKFQIRNSLSSLYSYFEKTCIQFENHLTNSIINPDFTVELGSFNKQNRKCIILDDTYHVSDGYIYFEDSRKQSKWKVEIDNLENSPRILIDTNFVGNISFPVNLIELMIQYILTKKGFSIIHASGVGQNNKCLIFPARSGGGKTTVALSLLERNFSFLGDNYIILNNGIAESYISPLNIFTYNRLSIIEENLSKKQKLSMVVKKMLYSFTGGYFKLFEKINPSEIFSKSIVDQLPIQLICILDVNTSSVNGGLSYQRLEKKDLIKKLRYNMELDLLYYSKWFFSYGYCVQGSKLSDFWKLYEQNLQQNLPNDVPYLSLHVPKKWNNSTIIQMLDIVNTLAEKNNDLR